jgi:dinuclear metal center YbgI/SA1388 family protein
MRVRELIRTIERTADPRLAASWDRSGVQIAGTVADCDRLAVALDPLPGVVEQALDWGAQCILTHHPLLLTPKLPDRVDDYHTILRLVLGQGAWLYAAHTSLDVATDGPAGWLATALDLKDRRILSPAGVRPHLQLRWHAPQEENHDRIAATLSALPRVQCRILGADILEVTCPEATRTVVADALTAACPAAVSLSVAILVEPADTYGYGLIGALPTPLSYPALAARLATLLPRKFFILAGEEPSHIRTLAYCPGSGADMAQRAFAAGADVYLTGDLKYHQAQGLPKGHLIVDVGHFSIEEVMMRAFAADLTASLGKNGPTIRYFSGNDPFSAHFPDGALPPRTE